MSNFTGFGTLGASKLMGLVAYGKFSQFSYNIFQRILNGPITEKKQDFSHISIDNYGLHDLAHTLQVFTIDKIKEHVYPLKSCDNLCIAGGGAYNGYMNEEFTKHYENVFVPPAVGEEVNYKEVAQAIADGKIVGWFQGKSESGNRALGNRSILADPRNPNIKD